MNTITNPTNLDVPAGESLGKRVIKTCSFVIIAVILLNWFAPMLVNPLGIELFVLAFFAIYVTLFLVAVANRNIFIQILVGIVLIPVTCLVILFGGLMLGILKFAP